MTFRRVFQWQCSYTAPISIPATPCRVRGGQAGRQTGRMSDSVPKAAQLSTFLRTTNASSLRVTVQYPEVYAGCYSWLIRCVQWTQSDGDEWWASQLAGPLFHLSYFLRRYKNRKCDGSKMYVGRECSGAAGGKQRNAALESALQNAVWETVHGCNMRGKLVAESSLVQDKWSTFFDVGTQQHEREKNSHGMTHYRMLASLFLLILLS